MDKLKMETIDTISENIKKIGELFPNVITESKGEDGKLRKAINFEKLAQELSRDVISDKEECYDFTWVGKNDALLAANTPIRKTLRPNIEESRDFENTQHLYIEGDNLEVLKILQESYLNKVKMIYIDPPYNTGEDYIYKDDFRQSQAEYDEESGLRDEDGNKQFTQNNDTNPRFHSDWCSMIYPRLKLARNLLTANGVMFISIDDHEVENLKKICDEIFGGQNFVTTIHVELSATQGMKVKAAKDGNIVKNAEYILIYTRNGHKNIANIPLYDFRPDFDSHYSKYLMDDNTLVNVKDVYLNLFPSEKNKNLTDMYREQENFRQFILDNINKVFADDKITGFNIDDFEINKVYHVNKNNRQYYIINNGTKLRQLMPLQDSFGQCEDFNKSYGLRKIRGDWWKEFYKDMGNVSKEGNIQFKNGKKPVRLIEQLLKMCASQNDIVLDFFSGSATTAHAVMQLNAEDGGTRKHIMVQLPELCDEKSEAYKAGYKNICEIGKERIRRAGDKIQAEIMEYNADLKIGDEPKKMPDIGFRVLKVDSTNMKDVYYSANDFEQSMLDELYHNIKPDRTAMDLLYGVLLDWGVELSAKCETLNVDGVEVYNYDEGSLVACLNGNKLKEDVIRKIAELHPLRVVFHNQAFLTSADNINLKEIFKSISPETKIKVM